MYGAPSPTPRTEFLAGLRGIAPLMIGSMPFALIFGALAVNSGLTWGAAAAMSAFVFAGSAQFVAVGLLSAHASTWVIVFTTLIVNLRHLLYGATLAPHLKALSQRWLIPLGFSMTDETFVVAIQRYNQSDGSPYKHWYHLGTSLPLYINWQLFTWIGLWAGRTIPNPGAWGLDFAFPATFIGMLVPLITSRSLVACVASAGAVSLLFHGLPHQLGLIIAAICGVVAGIIVEHWFPTPKTTPDEQATPPAYPRAKRP